MPNANTIERLVGAASPAQGALAIPSYVPTGTSATVIPNQLGNAAVLNIGGTQLLSGSSTAPSFGVNFDGFPFKLRIVGKVTTGASCNVTVAIQQGNSTTVTSGNTVATTSARAVNTTSATFFLEAICLWDNVKQTITGLQYGFINNVADPTIAIVSNAVSVTAQSSLQFVPVITVSATTGVTLTITEFVGETL